MLSIKRSLGGTFPQLLKEKHLTLGCINFKKKKIKNKIKLTLHLHFKLNYLDSVMHRKCKNDVMTWAKNQHNNILPSWNYCWAKHQYRHKTAYFLERLH